MMMTPWGRNMYASCYKIKIIAHLFVYHLVLYGNARRNTYQDCSMIYLYRLTGEWGSVWGRRMDMCCDIANNFLDRGSVVQKLINSALYSFVSYWYFFLLRHYSDP